MNQSLHFLYLHQTLSCKVLKKPLCLSSPLEPHWCVKLKMKNSETNVPLDNYKFYIDQRFIRWLPKRACMGRPVLTLHIVDSNFPKARDKNKKGQKLYGKGCVILHAQRSDIPVCIYIYILYYIIYIICII